jgi:mannose-1-phosphate guanylyltransferase
MKAVVLAAGLGTRLGPLTADRPKAAVPVARRPIVAHVVAHLHECGFDEIAVNVHYHGNQVREALVAARPRITWFEEPELLGTAGALAQMRSYLESEDSFLVHYGDVLTDHDVGGMLARHRDRNAPLTMLVHEGMESNSIVAVDTDWRVRSFLERPSAEERERVPSRWANSGVYAFDRLLLDLVPAAPSDVARDLVPIALARGSVFAEPLSGFRCAVDSPERIAEAERAFLTGRWRTSL